MIKLSFAGTGAAISQGRDWTSILVNDRILIDSGPTTPVNLKKMHKDIRKVDAILLTHYHGDHTFGLPMLLCDYAFVTKRESPLSIMGPKNVEEYVESLVLTAFPDVGRMILDLVPLRFFELPAHGSTFPLHNLKFETFPMCHGGIGCLGYKLIFDEETVGFSGDTEMCQGLTSLIKDTKILVLEMTTVGKRVPGHLNQEDIKEILKTLSPNQKVILTHLSPNEVPKIPEFDSVIFSEDLEEYAF
ncbi:MAG: ribonuclease Z [Armatimonadetes bacterium]|nr:ribonuclease Z [Armatimonadota bacterium]